MTIVMLTMHSLKDVIGQRQLREGTQSAKCEELSVVCISHKCSDCQMCTLTTAADHNMKNVNDDDINNEDNISDRIMMMQTMTMTKLLMMKSC